jgi:hypothetical protein
MYRLGKTIVGLSEYGTPQKPPQTLCAGSAFN